MQVNSDDFSIFNQQLSREEEDAQPVRDAFETITKKEFMKMDEGQTIKELPAEERKSFEGSESHHEQPGSKRQSLSNFEIKNKAEDKPGKSMTSLNIP